MTTWPIPSFEIDNAPDWHSVTTIQFGELYADGWIDFNDESWTFPSYSPEQHNRLCNKIIDRYFYREIGILPPGRWKLAFLRKLNEIMPKYIVLYKLLDNGASPLQTSDTYHKRRHVYSDYPATRLGGNQDYATTGDDEEYETIVNGDWIEKVSQIANDYKDVDVMILDELDICFCSILTQNVDGWF